MGQRLKPEKSGWQIPIVDRKRRLVGWTTTAPHYIGGAMHHHEAEALVGGAIVATYVQIDDLADAVRAGAPPEWKGPWRCLGLCSQWVIAGDGSWDDVRTISSQPAHP